MTVLVKHSKVSTIPDADNTDLVRPSDWNADHVVVGAAESGANSDITSLSGITGGISSPDYIQFDTAYATPLTQGQLGWDGNNTLALGMAGGNVIQHIGEDSFIYIKADAAITKGQVIMFTGAVGASGVLTGAPATGVTNPQYIMGIAAENLAHNAFGLVQTFGELTGINTNSFNEGDVLYYDSAVTGGLTNIFPASGPIVLVAAVAKKSAGNGTLVIRVSVTQRITAGTGATITQANTGTTVAVTNPYNPASVAITGGTINGTSIGATTPSTGTFTTITGQTEVLRGTGQNFRTQSNAILTANAYNAVNSTLTTVSTTTPIGSTASKFVMNNGANTGNNADGLNWASGLIGTGASGITATQSLYVKADSYTTLRLRSNVTGSIFDIPVAGPAPSPSGEIIGVAVSVLGDGWSRISWTFVTTSSAPGNRNDYWTLKTTAANGVDGLLIVGAQMEIGSSVGPYTPTTTATIYGTPTLSFSGVSEIGLQSNGALYLQPAGTGAIQAQAATSTTAGGNVRGANAVDWQTSRTNAAQVASATSSTIAGGANNTASANGCMVGGRNNTASAQDAFVGGGNSNTASGAFSAISGGLSNTSAGSFNFIGGGASNSGTASAAVTTQATTTVTNGSTAVTLSGSNANIRVGQLITGTGIVNYTYVAAISGTSLTLSQNANASGSPTLSFFTPHGVVVGGGNNQATGAYSFIGGGGDAGTASNRNVASGDWSFVGGGIRNTASGIASFVGGGGYSGTSITGNTASGTGSVVNGGFNNTASATGSSVLGGTTNAANALYTSVLGAFGNSRSIVGNTVFSATNAPISASGGLTQSALLVLARETTDATPTVLCSNSSAAGTTNQVILPNNSAYYFKGSVIANVTGAANGAAWSIEGAIMRGANAASTVLIDTPSINRVAASSGATAWTVAVTADTTNGGIAVTVTGAAGTTIRWVCSLSTTEVTF